MWVLRWVALRAQGGVRGTATEQMWQSLAHLLPLPHPTLLGL